MHYPKNELSLSLIDYFEPDGVSFDDRRKIEEIKDTPLWPLDISEILKLAKIMVVASIPSIISLLSLFVTGMICFGFIGNYGTSSELAGVSIASTWIIVFCYGIINCINLGFRVFASQLFGAGRQAEFAQSIQKTLWIIVLMFVPLVFLLIIMDRLLNMFEEDTQAGLSSAHYILYSIPSIFFSCLSDCFKGYLMAQNHFYAQGVIQGILLILHYFWCYLFVVVFEMPLAGIAIAKGITDLSTVVCFYFYMKHTGIIEKTLKHWNKTSLKECLAFFKIISVIGGQSYIQWMVFGIFGFMINKLQDEHVMGAHGLAITLAGILFMIAFGNSLTLQTYLGNAVGGGWKNRAQKVIFVGLSLNSIITIANIVFVLIGRDYLGSLFTYDPVTKEIFVNMISIYAMYHAGETFADHFGGILRTMEMAKSLIVIMGVCCLGIQCPLQWILGIELGYGYVGVWVAMSVYAFCLCGLLLGKFVKMNWDDTMMKVKTKIEKEELEAKTYIEMKSREI